MMNIVKMPVGAVPGKVGMDVINRLGLLFVLRLIATFASIFLYAQYRLSRAEHSEIRMKLFASLTDAWLVSIRLRLLNPSRWAYGTTKSGKKIFSPFSYGAVAEVESINAYELIRRLVAFLSSM